MNSEQQTLELIDCIYAAAYDQKLWQSFLEKCTHTLASQVAVMYVQDFRNNTARTQFTAGAEPEYRRSYEKYYAAKNIYLIRGKALLRPGRVTLSQELCPDTDVLRSEFYNDWVRPQRMERGINGVLFNEKSLVGSLGAIRAHGAPPFQPTDMQIMRLLLPHIQRAIQLQRRIYELEQLQQSTAEALDHWTTAVFLVDESGRVLLANCSAEKLLNKRDGLFLERGTLQANFPIDTGALHQSIREASCPGLLDGISRRTLTISRPSGQRPLSVFVAPASRSDPFFNSPGSALVFVSDPEGSDTPSTEILQLAYGLTPAEANVAALLATGKDIHEIADAICVRQNTVRIQLKRIFDKTGTRRQAELVKLILTGPAFLRISPHE